LLDIYAYIETLKAFLNASSVEVIFICIDYASQEGFCVVLKCRELQYNLSKDQKQLLFCSRIMHLCYWMRMIGRQ